MTQATELSLSASNLVNDTPFDFLLTRIYVSIKYYLGDNWTIGKTSSDVFQKILCFLETHFMSGGNCVIEISLLDLQICIFDTFVFHYFYLLSNKCSYMCPTLARLCMIVLMQ